MKKLIYSIPLIAIVLAGCAKHDFLDEICITGKIAPQAYWEVGSTTVTAGVGVPFAAQYYSSKSEIASSEAWYNLYEIEEKEVTCPWVKTFTYSKISLIEVEKRISQKISSYVHDESYWNDSIRAYRFEDTFPTSNTLRSVSWSSPVVFDSTKMVTYFGAAYMQEFKDSLKPQMQFDDYRNMYLGLGKLDNFMVYTDSTFNENTALYDYHFPKNAQGEEVVPYAMDSIFETLKFDELIVSADGYKVKYKRSYAIDAVLKVFDTDGTYGTTTTTRIALN